MQQRRTSRTPRVQTLTLGLGALLLTTGCLTSAAPARAQVDGGRLPTRWDKDVSPTAPLPEYPRPQMVRARWQSLNGPWQYTLTDAAATIPPAAYDGKILVPYPYEAALSGVGKASPTDRRVWYRRTFVVPRAWQGQRTLLHFGAVNWDSTARVNGHVLGEHKGGYDAFDYDITDALKPGDNEIVVSAQNPLRSDVPDGQVLGKQRMHPGSIFYTGATGIWQSVWLEPVPTAHIDRLKITPDVDTNTLHLTVQASGASVGDTVEVSVMDPSVRGQTSTQGAVGQDLRLPVPNTHLWTPDHPFLYDLKVALVRGGKSVDTVGSYFAMRKISLGKDAQGRTSLLLNNQPLFEVGALDQGYWPDGIYTAPTDAALKYDIQAAKSFGFNLLRKHAKVEPDRWYYWADTLGMLVWQDMPQAFGDLNDAAKAQWTAEWTREIATHYNHPSIVVWTTFNEGWGENTFDVPAVVALTRRLDPTRLVNNASGWTDKNAGDMHDTHAYPGPRSETPEAARAAVNGEFGGVTMNVPGHRWNAEVMGYGSVLSSSWQMTKNYQGLLKNAYGINGSRGTSAVVYTQLTDVEQEINGLLTYDRAVVKPIVPIVSAANQGRFPALPPDPNPPLVPTSASEPQTYRYVTDKPADGWTTPAFRDAAWKSGQGVFGHDAGNIRTPWTSSDIWLRRTVTLPARLPASIFVSVVHDEDVEVYLNGILAASESGYKGDYVSLPLSAAARAALKPGAANLIAVHCHQTTGGQAIDVGLTATK